MLVAPPRATQALQVNLNAVLKVNLAAYQTLAADYRSSSWLRLKHASRWLGKHLTRIRSGRRPRALDIGCADGSHAFYLAERGYLVTALDFSPRMIELAEARAANATPKGTVTPCFLTGEFLEGRFHDATGCPVTLTERHFDLVLANAFVHLFPAPVDVAVVRRALDLVAPGGRALFSTTIEDSRHEGFYAKTRTDGTQVDRWRGHYPEEAFLDLIRGAAGDPFDIVAHTTEDMRGKSWLTVMAHRAVRGQVSAERSHSHSDPRSHRRSVTPPIDPADHLGSTGRQNEYV